MGMRMEHGPVLDLLSEMDLEPISADDRSAIADAFAYAVRLTGDDVAAARSVAAAYAQLQDDLRAGRRRRRPRACLMASVNRQHGATHDRNYSLFPTPETVS